MENECVCRTCLQVFDKSGVTTLNCVDDKSEPISLRQKLECCVPELTVDIVLDSVICKTCVAALILCYQFKSSCLENEKILFKFIQQRKENRYDLLTTNDLLKITRKDVSEEHNYSCVGRWYNNNHISDNESESDGESVPLKLPAIVQTSFEALLKQAVTENKTCNNVKERNSQSKELSTKKYLDSPIISKDKNEAEEVTKSRSIAGKTRCERNKSEEKRLSSETAVKTSSNLELDNNVTPTKTLSNSKTSTPHVTNEENDLSELTNSANNQDKQLEIANQDQVQNEIKISNPTSPSALPQSGGTVNSLGPNIPEDAEVTEKGCEENKRTRGRRYLQRRRIPRRNPRYMDDQKNWFVARCLQDLNNSLPGTTDAIKSNEAKIEMNKQDTMEKHFVTGAEEIITPKKYSSTDTKTMPKQYYMNNETNYDGEYSDDESTPYKNSSLVKPKESCSNHNTPAFEDSIENDLLQIQQMIMQNSLAESSKASPRKNERKRYPCTKCGKGYNYRSHFAVHSRTHAFKKMFTCPTCQKGFSQEKYLQSHRALHAGRGLYQCNICLKHLSAATALKRHHRTHTGEKPYSCAYCEKKFAQKIQLAVHTRTHTGAKPFICHICKASFTQKTHLMGHMRIHTGEKPFKCDQCPRAFRKGQALQIHKHSHNMKPFQCKVCNFLFKDADVFQRHIHKHLISLNTTGSHILNKSRPPRRVLDELQQDVEDINIVAYLNEQANYGSDKPRRSMIKSRNSTKELKIYSFYCEICNQGFTTKFNMQRHASTHSKESSLSNTM